MNQTEYRVHGVRVERFMPLTSRSRPAAYRFRAMPLLACEMGRETVKPRGRAKFIWPDAALLRLAALAFFGLMAEGAIGDWLPCICIQTWVLRFRSQLLVMPHAIAMAAGRFSGDWLAQRFSGKNILRAWSVPSLLSLNTSA